MQFPTRPPAPPTRPRAAPAGITGQFPIAPGTVVGAVPQDGPPTMSPHEYAALLQAGWDPNTPVPAAFQEQLKAVAADAARPRTIDPAAVPPFTPPQEVALASLPPDMRDELGRWLQSMQGAAAQPPPPPLSPTPTPPPPPQKPGITTADAVDYLRAVKGGPAFTREYTLFGGAVRVTFRQANLTDSLSYPDAPVDRRLRSSTAQVTVQTVDGPKAVSPSDVSPALGPVLRDTFAQFEGLIARLTQAAGDASFWTAIARWVSFTEPTSPVDSI